MVKGIRPRDDNEGMLAAQMTAVHIATMTAARRLANVETIDQQDSASNMFNKCARTFTAQVEALKKYRSTGEQSIKVQHVNVHDGGQAIVTSTMQTGGGGNGKRDDQPHESSAAAATGPALLGNIEAHAPAMPSASSSGLDRLPVPRSTRRSSDRQA
jgi:hypothetical protein